jgi:serine/threonine-protein kinase
MICSTCNASNAEAAKFCSGCGVELRARNTVSQQTSVPEGEITRQHSGRAVQEATVVDRAGDPLLGSTIEGKYRIDAKLGEGGMGAVYSASRLLIGDVVAVKILHAEQNDPKAADRFRREAQAAARLKHPNAVTIHDFGITSEGLQYLVMELLEGQSLRQIIKQDGPLPPPVAAEITTQACAALDEAHQRHIVHRDIKPDNIIINSTIAGLRVKVLDFGIAKLRDDLASHLTQTGSVMGTPHYMSPEQCLGEELDSRADIYSMGIVLYEMLCGRVPFNSPVSTAVVVQHVNQPPQSLRTINLGISPQVEAVVFHALEKRRDARPATAGAFAQELIAAVHATSAQAPGLSRWPQMSGRLQPPTHVSEEKSSGVPRGLPRQNEMPATVHLRAAQGSGPTPSVRSTVPSGTLGVARTNRRLLLTIGAAVFGVVVFGAVVAMITWNLTREKKPNDIAELDQGDKQDEKSSASPASLQTGEKPTRFIVTSCNSIKDTQTLLEWFVGPDRDMTWFQAQQWTVDLDNCDGRWRMPTIEEIRTLYEPQSKAGVGYYTGGEHFPAHINSVFNAIGGGSWVWADERVGDDARSLNLNQGKAVMYSALNTVYSTRAFAVRNFKK